MKTLRSIIILFTLLFPLRGAAQLNVVPRLVAERYLCYRPWEEYFEN